MAKEFSNEYVKYEFDETEKKEISVEMARKIAEKQETENAKKAVTSDFTSKIANLDSEVTGAAIKLNNGYEYRDVKCEIIKDFENNTVSYMRVDTCEIVRTRKMRAEDSQESFIE